MKEINLKKIYEDKFFETICRHTPGPNPEGLPHCSKESIRIHMNSPAADAALIAMKEACKQVLELASKNAKVNETYIEDYYHSIYDGKEAHAIHTDGDGDAHALSLFTIDINSITNTITQVK